jgi:hypothetical protein
MDTTATVDVACNTAGLQHEPHWSNAIVQPIISGRLCWGFEYCRPKRRECDESCVTIASAANWAEFPKQVGIHWMMNIYIFSQESKTVFNGHRLSCNMRRDKHNSIQLTALYVVSKRSFEWGYSFTFYIYCYWNVIYFLSILGIIYRVKIKGPSA